MFQLSFLHTILQPFQNHHLLCDPFPSYSLAALQPPTLEEDDEEGQAAHAELAAEEERFQQEEEAQLGEWRHRVMSVEDVDEVEVSE